MSFVRRVCVFALMALLSACVVDANQEPPSGDMEVTAAKTALTASPDAACTWHTYNGHEYWFCETTRSWQTARAQCQAIGLDLASITSSAENTFVKEHLSGASWVGANDTGSEGVWRWVQTNVQFWQGGAFGSPVAGAYRNWGSLQPDNLANQDCGAIESLGVWSDYACSHSKLYVCESVDDLCPADANKNAPGQCGCGTADTDSDQDGTADCRDQCPADEAKTRPGDCGCANSPRPQGTTCHDGLCAANNSCDGHGTCGNPAACGVPDSLCHYAARAETPYWICNNDRSFSDARSRCQAVGMDLALIENEGEDDFITDELFEHTFIGASDQSVEGDFRWVKTGAQFWDNGPNGSSYPGSYSNWEAGQPSDGFLGSQDCVVKDPAIGDGLWETRKCTDKEAYVCERIDLCPNDVGKLEPGVCGCGLADVDTDGDGTLDCNDECPYDHATTTAGPSGCTPPSCTGALADLTPTFQCVLSRSNGTKAAVFSVRNTSSCIVNAPLGSTNRVSPTTGAALPPTRFEPGFARAFTTPIGTTAVTWTLGSRTATATSTGPACDNIEENVDAPVKLTAGKNGGSGSPGAAHGSTSTPLSFQVPAHLLVTLGNAANGTATLTYRNGTGPLVTCTYRGGSSVAEPDTDLDRARGRYYTLQSCSNGKTGGQSDTATQWDLTVNSGDPRNERTVVEVPIGRGCDGRLDSFISPEETVQLRQSFDWTDTEALLETDPTGLPALRYALIYLETREQFDGLKRMKIFFRQRPIFASQLERYRGKCGVFDNAGDMHGVFVHALIPAAVYNYLRAVALQVIDDGQGEIPLRAIVLRDVPDQGLANQDGTVSWQALYRSQFNYFEEANTQQPNIFDDAFEIVTTTLVAGPVEALLVQVGEEVVDVELRVAPKLDDIVETVANLVETVNEAVADVLGELASFIYGSSRLKVQLTILNRDPGFDTNATMQRAWGPGWGGALVPEGAEAEFVAWGVSPPPALGVMPFSDSDEIDASGRFTLDIANNLLPTSAPGQGLCIHMETDAAMISDGITENEYCDFDPAIDNTGTIGVGNRDLPRRDDPSDPEYYQVSLSHEEFNYLTQLTDANAYVQAVIGRPLIKQAEVGIGIVANTMAGGTGRAFAGCFDYAEMGDALQTFGNSPVGLFAYSMGAKDIFFPEHGVISGDPDEASTSRGIATHEYGHFLMCEVFHENPDDLERLYAERVIQGEGDTAIAMESFADFFASQIVSGTNYFATDNTDETNDVDYCDQRNCFEQNYRGLSSESPTEDDYDGAIRRMMSTYHDAFDRGSDDWRSTLVPTNGDAWLQPTATGPYVLRGPMDPPYMQNFDPHDEIALSGPLITDWLSRVAGEAASAFTMQRALADTIYTTGESWCRVCPLFAAHDTDFNASSATLHTIWEACQEGELADIVGEAPDPTLRIDATTCGFCPTHHFSNAQGQCTQCTNSRDVVVDNSCSTCPDGTIPDGGREECLDCADDEISVGVDCVPCGIGRTRIRGTNTCTDCTVDETLDAATFDALSCGEGYFDVAQLSPVGDNCPDEFTLELLNADLLATTLNATFEVKVRAFDAVDAVQCPLTSVHTEVNQIEFGTSPASPSFLDYFVQGQVCSNPGACEQTCRYEQAVRTVTPAIVTSHGLTAVRFGFRVDPGEPATSVIATALGVCPGPL